MKRTKDFRRFQKEKYTKKTFNFLILDKIRKYTNTQEELLAEAKKISDNRKVNQCQCCCNPRHSSLYSAKEKKTIQERRADENTYQDD